MSTRADFYIGRGLQACWVGSIGRDAFVDFLAPYFDEVTDEAQFRGALQKVFNEYGEISAEHGWPWPWASSEVTGTAIAFDEGCVWVTHPSGCWAPLADWTHSGTQPCEFADMLAEEAATAQGQLCGALRRGTTIRLKAGTPVLPHVLTRLAYLLDRSWLHSHETGDQLRMLSPSLQVQDEIFDLSRVLQRHRDTVRTLVAEQQAADGEAAWALVDWACDHLWAYYRCDTVEVALTDDLPVQFGRPLQRDTGRKMHLPDTLHLSFVPLDGACRAGRAHLEAVLDAVPFLHAYVLAHELKAHGVLRASDDIEAWLDGTRPSFAGQTWRDICTTREGRLLANQAAADLRWQA